ncbi:MAG: hypothetical protein K0Q60_4696 [Microvirga sp.]|jgi:hypothetical protein|nr:hypothetical protein [Microvirga sp.]
MPDTNQPKRRGRPPLPDHERKGGANLTFRARSGLRERLVEEAEKSGRSISEEIEFRLNDSFDRNRRIEDEFGGQEIFGIMKTIAWAMRETGRAAGFITTRTSEGANHWLTNPYAFDQAVKAVQKVLEAVRPEGEIVPPKATGFDVLDQALADLGPGFANTILEEIETGEPRSTGSIKRTEDLRRDLGTMVHRIQKGRRK